jgi:TonB family protein
MALGSDTVRAMRPVRRAHRWTGVGLVAACLAVETFAQASWKPAKFREGTRPVTPVQAVAGGEVFVEATVTKAGRVGGLATLRTSPPFTQYVLDAVRDWQFQPAEEMTPKVPGDPGSIVSAPVESKVVIACVFRPPTLNSPTLGEPPKNVQPASDDVAIPLSTVTPLYPPLAVVDATVLVEVRVGVNGRVVSATTVRSAAGFDESALAAARQWTFRPARIHGRLEETLAYIVFGFRQPVTSPSRR